MFKINKNNTEFIFLEAKEKVTVYISKDNQVKQLIEFNLSELSSSIENLKKSHSELSKSKNIWLLTTRTESIEKAPLNKEEMFNYAKWKIQEIVDVPLHDIYYDILTNNTIESNFYKKYATAVIAKKSHIDFILNAFAGANIPLQAIDCRETAMLDFFEREASLLNKKALAFLKIEEDRAVMCVYFEDGVVFNRVIELPLLKQYIGRESEIDEETYRMILDKLCLEIQRNVDFLDRQYSVQHFENIIYSLPRNSILINLATEISQYFNVKGVDLYRELNYKSAENEIVPLEILASFERGKVRLEHINLIPKVEKVSSFNDDFKKVLVVSLLAGVCVSAIGSYYEWKARSMDEQAALVKKDKEKLEQEVGSLKSQVVNSNNNLEKEIDNLLRNKNEIIKMQSLSSSQPTQSYNKIMKDIAVKAKSSGVILKHIKYDDNGLLLEGLAQTKDLFTAFLSNLQNAENLKGKSLSLISIQQQGGGFEFRVSSENMGGK
jgi:Tfp pilus assembly protein PilN